MRGVVNFWIELTWLIHLARYSVKLVSLCCRNIFPYVWSAPKVPCPPLEDHSRGRGLPWKARHPRPGCSPVCLRASTVSWRWSSRRSPTPGRDICRSPPARWATGAVCRCRCCRSLRNPSPRSSLRRFCIAPHRHKCESKFSKSFRSSALPSFPTQPQILTETL